MNERSPAAEIFNKDSVRTVLKLVVASAVVGALMSFFGLHPLDILEGLSESVHALFDNLNAIVSQVISWVILGGMVVIPIWLILSLPRRFKKTPPPASPPDQDARL